MSCDKFKELFIQEDEIELSEHIKNCETCRLEYEKMLKTEQLIKEAKPLYAVRKKNKILIQAAASMVLVFLASIVMMQTDFNNIYVSKIVYDESISEYMPVDEYGLADIY